MQSLSHQLPNLATEDTSRQSGHPVPGWVKGLIAVGAILFLLQLPGLPRSLADAVQKQRAVLADSQGNYEEAIDQYQELRTRYSADKKLIKLLGFAQYHAGQYHEALETLLLLEGETMPKREVDEINAVLIDTIGKLNHKTNEGS